MVKTFLQAVAHILKTYLLKKCVQALQKNCDKFFCCSSLISKFDFAFLRSDILTQHRLSHQREFEAKQPLFTIIITTYNKQIIKSRLLSADCRSQWRNLTHVTQHFDAGLHVSFLTREQPVAVIHTKHSLQQLHKHGLPSLRERERDLKQTLQAMLQSCTDRHCGSPASLCSGLRTVS